MKKQVSSRLVMCMTKMCSWSRVGMLLLTLSTIQLAHGEIDKNSPLITGHIIDELDSASVEFATVQLLNAKHETIASALTLIDGSFTLDANEEGDSILISHLAYISKTIAVTSATTLGNITLAANVSLLDDLNVMGEASKTDLNKDSYVMTNSLKQGSTKLDDVLERIEGVSVDKFSGDIDVDNSSRVLVMANGMKKNMDYVRKLDPKKIKTIEIIRNVTGRYSSEYDAIINVVLKDDIIGFDAMIEMSPSLTPTADHLNEVLLINDGGISMNYTKNKLTLYSDINSRYNCFEVGQDREVNINDTRYISSSADDGLSKQSWYNSFTLGSDYCINDDQIVSVELYYKSSPEAYNYQNSIYESQVFVGDSLTDNFTTGSSSTTSSDAYYATLFYKGEWNDKLTLNSDLTFNAIDNHTAYSYIDNPGYEEHVQDNKQSVDAAFDFIYTLTDKWQLEFGSNLITTQNTSDFNIGDEAATQELTTLVSKNYLYTSYTLNEKQSVKFGGLYERYTSKYKNSNTPTNSQNSYSPYFIYNYTISPRQNIKLRYSTTPEYPSITELSPVQITNDYFSHTTGNSDLVSSWKHKAEARITLLGQQLTLTPYFHFENQQITNFGVVENDKIAYTYANMGDYRRKGLKISSSLNYKSKLFFNAKIDLYNESIMVDDNAFGIQSPKDVNDCAINIQSFYMSHKHNYIAGINYQRKNLKHINLRGYESHNNSYTMLFAKKSFIDDRLSVMAAYILPIEGLGIDYGMKDYASGNSYSDHSRIDVALLKNLLTFQLSYRFGNTHDNVKKVEKDVNYDSGESKGMF